MLKKLLSLVAGAALCMTANAEVVVDWEIDYTSTTWNYYVMGYIPSQENGWLTVTQTRGSWERVDGVPVYTPNDKDEDGDGQPDVVWYQLFVGDGIPTQVGKDYTVTVYGKANVEAGANMNIQWGWGDGQQIPATFNFGTEWEEISVTYPEIGGSSCALVFQPGVQETTFEIKWIKVSHNEKADMTEWIDLLVNGDAEGEYGEIPCCYAKSNVGDNAGEPVPAEIVEIDGGHAFICRAGEVDGEAEGHAWANQFWIQAPQSFKTGDIFKVSFRCKATQNARTATQAHAENPGSYLHWMLLGDVNFTTDWQSISKTVTVETAQNGMWSAAFNLNEAVFTATDFYLDDLKWEVMKLQEGWFVATDMDDSGTAYEMYYNDEEAVWEVVVGRDAPVGAVKISTKKGNENAFNANCIKPVGEIIDGEFMPYEVGFKKILLPEEGTWTIQIDEVAQQVGFTKGDITGINSVAVEDLPVVYFNLQGVQVQNPSNGVYIMKQGNTVRKVYRK